MLEVEELKNLYNLLMKHQYFREDAKEWKWEINVEDSEEVMHIVCLVERLWFIQAY